MVCKLFSSPLYLFEDTSNSIPISMGNMLKSEVFFEECSPQPRCAINEKHSIYDFMFLLQFLQELLCQEDGSHWKQPNAGKFVRSRINSGVQPGSLVVELNHGFVDRDVIRALPGFWL
jgi:hypothetical protein